MFSATDMVGTVAFFSGSSGSPKILNLSKCSRFGSKCMSWTRICPSLTGRCPDKASTSSLWPLPDTPAMPTISPAWTLRSNPVTVSRPSSFSANRPAISNVVPLFGAAARAAEGRTTASPIIIAAISRVETAPTLPPPTRAPRLSTLRKEHAA
jgi:hypothetical protein